MYQKCENRQLLDEIYEILEESQDQFKEVTFDVFNENVENMYRKIMDGFSGSNQEDKMESD